jgi:hypothetical protein
VTALSAWAQLQQAVLQSEFLRFRQISPVYPNGYVEALRQEAIMGQAGAAGIIIDSMADQ